jgi:hypothetical protein
VAFLQEVQGLPEDLAIKYASTLGSPIRKTGAPQRFSSVILVRGSVGDRIELTSPTPWVNPELKRFAGNLMAVELVPDRGPRIQAVGVYSPAWPLQKSWLEDIDTTGVKLQLNPRVWVADLLWSALSEALPRRERPWIIAGDFNLCETFDSWRGGPRGNREYLDRMAGLGLVECLRHARGKLTPTYRSLKRNTVTAQLDYIFVTPDLAAKLVRCETAPEDVVFGQGLSDHLPVVADFDF